MANQDRIEAMDALGDPTRRAVFEALRGGPRSVGDIASGLPVSRPAVSQHLKLLKGAGLVSDEPDGTRRIYRIDRDGLEALRAYVDGFWDDALGRYRSVAESGIDSKSSRRTKPRRKR